jgi:hypothetical protein
MSAGSRFGCWPACIKVGLTTASAYGFAMRYVALAIERRERVDGPLVLGPAYVFS